MGPLGHQTKPQSSIRETLFSLAYGTNALLPLEVGLDSYKHEVFNVKMNEWGIHANLNLFEEEIKGISPPKKYKVPTTCHPIL